MINFCHIAPTKYLSRYAQYNGGHLILAHLVESDEEYRNFYANLNDGKYKIMDNSAFEMFKQGRPMYDSSKLIEMGKQCKANCIVMSDYPREPWTKTVRQAEMTCDQIRDSGFGTFFVPQSTVGDLDGYLRGIEWALNKMKIDIIGLSILGCPIALGVDEKMSEGNRGSAYKLQRFLARWKIFQELEKRDLLGGMAWQRFHCLGMTDGPNEIALLEPYHEFICSWDSSAAIWLGLNGKQFDSSPTGLSSGKFEKEVDFSCDLGDSNHQQVINNINTINKMVGRSDSV